MLFIGSIALDNALKAWWKWHKCGSTYNPNDQAKWMKRGALQRQAYAESIPAYEPNEE